MSRATSTDGTVIAYATSGTLLVVDGALCSRGFGPSPKLAPLLVRHFTVTPTTGADAARAPIRNLMGRSVRSRTSRAGRGGRRLRRAIRYFMKDMVGAPGFVVVMMRLMPWIWRKLPAGFTILKTRAIDEAVDWASRQADATGKSISGLLQSRGRSVWVRNRRISRRAATWRQQLPRLAPLRRRHNARP